MSQSLRIDLKNTGRCELGRLEINGCRVAPDGGVRTPVPHKDRPDFYGVYLRGKDGLARHLFDVVSRGAAVSIALGMEPHLDQFVDGDSDRSINETSVQKNAAAIAMSYDGPAPDADFWDGWESFIDYVVSIARALEENLEGTWAENYDWYQTMDHVASTLSHVNSLVGVMGNDFSFRPPSAEAIALAALKAGRQ